MKRARRTTSVRFAVVFALLGGAGIAALLFLAIKQRAPLPGRDVYTLNAAFTEASGVQEGIGQPVNVAGVRVGRITKARVVDGRALLTLEIERDKLRRVTTDATASLIPITPLKDMQIELDPGSVTAAPLRDGATLGAGRTNPPVALSDLLSTLDTDTRTLLSSLITTLGRGTRGNGDDLRRALLVMGPTTAQVRRITQSLAGRRRELARLVHNVAAVTRAASRDGRLDDVVEAGERTLSVLAAHERPLRAALRELPPTLRVTRSTLTNLEPFAQRLEPALRDLLPAVRRLPSTLPPVRRFAATTRAALHRDIRPLVREANPLLADLAPATRRLSRTLPDLSRTAQILEYVVNELAYNPPGADEGFLFWLAWFGHNFNSSLSNGDAHGTAVRTSAVVTCQGLERLEQLQRILGVFNLCPG